MISSIVDSSRLEFNIQTILLKRFLFFVNVQKTAPHLKYKASDMKNIIVIPSEDIPV